MDYFFWTVDFIEVFGLWTIGAFIFLYAFKKIKQKLLTKNQKYVFWTIILFSAFFHWSMTTYDPHPTEGPIDSLFYDKQKADDIARQEMEDFVKQKTTITIDSVTNLVSNLNIVKDKIKLIDSLSKGQRHISLVPTLDNKTKNIYLVKICEDNETNKVTYFNFLVDANSMTIVNADGKLDGQ